MVIRKPILWLAVLMVFIIAGNASAQNSVNDTIRLGAITENGKVFPMIFLPEYMITGQMIKAEDRKRRDKLRNDIFTVYPYAITASAIFKDVNAKLDSLDRRRDRKKYLKSIDKTLDASFKEPLKSLSIDQGHVLIKLINRQTGQNCYSIIKELKGGFNAMLWQSVGIFFNNNLVKEYDPDGPDQEVEALVKELETSNAYKYQLYQQQALLKKVGKPAK